MGRSEIACARCRRLVPVDQLMLWEQYEKYRVFHGPVRPGHAPETADAPARTGVYSQERKRCAYLTCEDCHASLKKGGGLDDLHNRKVAIYAGTVVALGVVIIILTPIVLPSLLIAFWHW